MKTSTRVILLIIFVLILAGGVIAGVMFLNNRDNDDETQEEKELTWEEEYTKVLKSEDEFEEMKDLKLSLCDLNQDETPELVVFCSNTINEFIAKIYSIKENKLEKKEIALNENFNLEYLYNQENEECNWYVVTEKSNDIYNIKLEDTENITEDNKVGNKENLISIGTSVKTEFEKTTDEIKAKEMIEIAKEKFVKNEEIKNTKEAETKIETAKTLKDVKKIDTTKGIVYPGRTYEADNYANVTGETFHNYYEYPVINIDSDDVREINAKIKERYGFDEQSEEFLWFGELEVTTYDYYINNNMLSVIVMHGGNDSTWTTSYNVDLKTGQKITGEKLLFDAQASSAKLFDLDKVKELLKEYAIKEIDKSTTEMKNAIGQNWDSIMEDEVAKIKNEVDKNLENIDNVYVNSEGNLCCRVEYQIFGGQWTCTKTIEIDTSNNSIKEIKFEDYMSRGLGNQNK